jgi:hypothetical protein
MQSLHFAEASLSLDRAALYSWPHPETPQMKYLHLSFRKKLNASGCGAAGCSF